MKKLFWAFIVMILLPIQVALAATLNIRAYGNDTVAGYSSLLKSSLLSPGKDMVFVVEKPDKSVVRLSAKADFEGIAEAELFGMQTKIAGEYKVALVYPGSADASPQNTFQVHPDAVSPTQSKIAVEDALLTADGSEKSRVTVTLFDAYRNPIPSHMVKLISSRREDKIEALEQGSADPEGAARFTVQSDFPGLSVFTAIDNTVNVVLADREEVVFQAPMAAPREIGGNLLQSNLLGADLGQGAAVVAGPVRHFEIEDLPTSVKVNEQVTLTVVAKDQNDNVAKNYTGTILLAVPSDQNAVLPSNGEYTFRERDQGRFTFNLALQFSSLGRHKFQVFDKDDWDVSGEKEVEVVSAQAVPPASAGSALQIKSPTDGSTLGNSLVVLSGQGEPNLNLKIFDQDNKIGDSETDMDGFFSFEARGLESGSHTMYVMSDQGLVSNSVTVQIDTLPPVINSFTVYPEGPVKAGEQLNVHLQSEPNLETVKVRLQGSDFSLSPGADAGVYEGTLSAPAARGQYQLDVILADALSNKAELLNQLTLQVVIPEPAGPAAVQGVEGEALDSEVVLRWNAPVKSEIPVARYRIYYGSHFETLNQLVDTQGPVTEFRMKNLKNGAQTFFAVAAIDSQGNESQEKSVTLALTPKAPEAPAPLEPVGAPSSGYQTVPFNGALELRWPAFAEARAFYYKVYFGLRSGQYDDFSVTENNTPRLVVSDLINGIPYYFRVAALDLGGREISSLSPEFSGVPGSAPSGLYGAAPASAPYGSRLQEVPFTQKTGPEVLWVISGSLLFAGFLYRHRRKFLTRGK